jgi:hypothetical protein
MNISDNARVVKRLGQILVMVALLAAMGTHWVVFQSVAWTTMLAGNLRTTSLPQAVQRTFDGKHPCSLCKQIERGKKTEKKTTPALELRKFEFAHEHTVFAFCAPADFTLLRAGDDSASTQSKSPPLPPPKFLQG